jgi:hypothetical protein
MAIKISNTTVIDNSRNFIPVTITAGGVTGTSGQVLKSTGTGIIWGEAEGGGGGSGAFDVGISTSIYISVSSGIATGVTNTNNIFVAPGIGYTFPSTAGIQYVIESIQVSNKFSNELYLSTRHDYNGGVNTPITQRVVIPYQGAVELLNQPVVANPSDVLRFQSLDSPLPNANGIDGGLDIFMTLSAKQDSNYVGLGTTVTSLSVNGDQIFYTSTGTPTVIQSIRLTNYNLFTDIDARVSIYRGETRLGYLVYDLTIPKNSVIEILERPKYLAAGDSIRVSESADGISINISGKKI